MGRVKPEKCPAASFSAGQAGSGRAKKNAWPGPGLLKFFRNHMFLEEIIRPGERSVETVSALLMRWDLTNEKSELKSERREKTVF